MKIGFIGCGNMGGALARAVASLSTEEIYLYDKDSERAEALALELSANAVDFDTLGDCDFLFLGVKPNIIEDVTAKLANILSPECVVISMAAGVTIEKIARELKKPRQIIRIMPNTPVAYGEGMILYTTSDKIDEERVTAFLNIMRGAGTLDRIPERLMDAGSAVSGCGPAFVYMFIEAMADGGVLAGLPRDKAMLYAAKTVLGAAKVALESGKHPAELKDMVCSPGGSTIEGVIALESGGMRGVVESAITASHEKTKKLGK